jgi:arsenate reductase (glutaredoxin)
MLELTIYHNPKCSKSRQTLDIIESNNIKPKIKLYLKEEITYDELNDVLKKLNIRPRELLRKNEAEYKENNMQDPSISDKEIIRLMISFPKLIERPIVISKDKAILGRPPENVMSMI